MRAGGAATLRVEGPFKDLNTGSPSTRRGMTASKSWKQNAQELADSAASRPAWWSPEASEPSERAVSIREHETVGPSGFRSSGSRSARRGLYWKRSATSRWPRGAHDRK